MLESITKNRLAHFTFLYKFMSLSKEYELVRSVKVIVIDGMGIQTKTF